MRTKKHHQFYKCQWIFARAFLLVWITALTLSIGKLIWDAITTGSPLASEQLIMALVMLIAGSAMVWLMRHWFNFLAGEEICRWRYRIRSSDDPGAN